MATVRELWKAYDDAVVAEAELDMLITRLQGEIGDKQTQLTTAQAERATAHQTTVDARRALKQAL